MSMTMKIMFGYFFNALKTKNYMRKFDKSKIIKNILDIIKIGLDKKDMRSSILVALFSSF